MFNELNKRNTVKTGINTNEMEFKPLKDFCGSKMRVDGFFFTNGRYGKQVVIVAGGYLINMPARAVEQFEVVERNTDMLNAMLNGHMEIHDIKLIDTKNGQTTAYELGDC